MKANLHVLGLLLFLVPFGALAQSPHPILKSLTAYKQPNGILLRWVIAGGNQCNGTKVFRATNEVSFEQIEHIEGICGSTSADEVYTYFDPTPFPNQYNHYKLELGYQGFSESVTAFFEKFNNANHSVLFDFEKATFRILFSNDLNLESNLTVFNSLGQNVYSASGTDSDLYINTSGWNAGVYVFRISGVSEADIHGKLYFGRR